MNGNPTLEQLPMGAGVSLRAAGEWTVHHAPDLEKIVDRAERMDSRSGIIIDVSQVSKLDTFGAWLIERMRRNLTKDGADTRIAG